MQMKKNRMKKFFSGAVVITLCTKTTTKKNKYISVLYLVLCSVLWSSRNQKRTQHPRHIYTTRQYTITERKKKWAQIYYGTIENVFICLCYCLSAVFLPFPLHSDVLRWLSFFVSNTRDTFRLRFTYREPEIDKAQKMILLSLLLHVYHTLQNRMCPI